MKGNRPATTRHTPMQLRSQLGIRPTPAVLLKIYIYDYQSSRRLERECPRNFKLNIVAADWSGSPAPSTGDQTRG